MYAKKLLSGGRISAFARIAALLLARTTQREREIAIRYSLGASRASVLAQLLTESLVLALIGSTVGLALASAASNMFQSLAKSMPRVNDEITTDWRISAYPLLCGVTATVLFGLAPAWQASSRSVSGRLARNSRNQVSAGTSLQCVLVGTQVALAVTLLVGTGLIRCALSVKIRSADAWRSHGVTESTSEVPR